MSEQFKRKLVEWHDSPTQMVKDLFNVRPDAWQEEALESYPKSSRLAMKACKGPGKLQPKSVKLDTPDGLMRWGDVRVGTRLFAEDGSPTRVTSVFEQGVVSVYRVMFDDGSSTLAGGEHLWKVKGRAERQKNLGWTVINTEEIIQRGITVPNGRWAQKQFIIPQQGPVQYAASLQPVDSYVAGVWIGDGTKNKHQYSKPSIEVEQEIRRRGYETARKIQSGRCDTIVVHGSLDSIECFSVGSHERFIPDLYKYASIQQRRDMLCGLMDTDGCIGDDSHMEYSTTSKRLAEDVVWIVRSLGGIALVKEAIKDGWYRDENGERVECRDCYRVTLRTPFNPFLIPHKAERWRDPYESPSTERYITRFIAKIEPAGEEDSMCVEVDHPSRCYLTNDFIVTHNTCVLAWIAWNFLLTRPDPKMAATSVSGDNLKDGFWAEMTKWQSRSEILSAMFDATTERIFNRENPKNWWMSARTWPKTGTAEDQANTLAGLHADYIMFILDESGSIPDAVMVTAEAALAGGPIEAHVIQAGNPTQLTGPLYRACTSAREIWKVIEITGDPDNPNRTPRISREYALQQIKQYGRYHPYVLVNIFGEFPPSSLNALIGPDEVRAAMRRYYRAHELGRVPKIIGVDVSRYGDDESVLAFREGMQAYAFKGYRNINGEEGASILNREWAYFGADGVFLDGTGGWGSSWEDNLRRLGRAPAMVQFNASPHEKTRFANKRAEMYWEMCDWIRRGGAIPPDEDFLREVTETTYSIPKDVIVLEPKDALKARIGRSPDRADALALTFAEPVSAVGSSARRVTRNAAEYDPFGDMDKSRGSVYAGTDYSPFR